MKISLDTIRPVKSRRKPLGKGSYKVEDCKAREATLGDRVRAFFNSTHLKSLKLLSGRLKHSKRYYGSVVLDVSGLDPTVVIVITARWCRTGSHALNADLN